MPGGPTGAQLSLALPPGTGRALDVSRAPPGPASAAPGLIQPWLYLSQDDLAPKLYPVGTAASDKAKGQVPPWPDQTLGTALPAPGPLVSPVLLVPAFESLGGAIWEEGKQAALHLPRAPDSHQLGGTLQGVGGDVVGNVVGVRGLWVWGQEDLTALLRSLSLRSGGRTVGLEEGLRGGRAAVWGRQEADRG